MNRASSSSGDGSTARHASIVCLCGKGCNAGCSAVPALDEPASNDAGSRYLPRVPDVSAGAGGGRISFGSSMVPPMRKLGGDAEDGEVVA